MTVCSLWEPKEDLAGEVIRQAMVVRKCLVQIRHRADMGSEAAVEERSGLSFGLLGRLGPVQAETRAVAVLGRDW